MESIRHMHPVVRILFIICFVVWAVALLPLLFLAFRFIVLFLLALITDPASLSGNWLGAIFFIFLLIVFPFMNFFPQNMYIVIPVISFLTGLLLAAKYPHRKWQWEVAFPFTTSVIGSIVLFFIASGTCDRRCMSGAPFSGIASIFMNFEMDIILAPLIIGILYFFSRTQQHAS